MKQYDHRHFEPATAADGRLNQFLRVLGELRGVAEDAERDVSAPAVANFYKEALDEAAIVAITDVKGTILSVNAKFCEISGYTAEELIGANHRIIRSGNHDKTFFNDFYRVIRSGHVWRGEICNRTKAGELYWVDTTVVPHRGNNGRIERFIAIRFDVTPRKIAESRLWTLAKTDPLTGLHNRRKFMKNLNLAIESSENGPSGIGIALIDVDHFKDINDSFGHDTGDAVLRTVATRLQDAIGHGDEVARLGGDEFAVIFRNIQSRTEITERAKGVLDALARPIPVKGIDLDISASIGLALHPEHGSTSNDLLKNSDIALYSAKDSGRSRSVIFDEDLHAASTRRAALHADVSQGLKKGEFLVHYQPVTNARGDSPLAMEALLRWNQGGAGLIQPPQFLGDISDEALIARIDEFVLEQVLRQIEEWRRRAVPFEFIAVNATVCDLRTPAYVDRILDAINRNRIRKEDICVEINEMVMIGRGGSAALNEVSRLHEAGVRIAFDDFGTGYASLRHLRDLPISIVKIDKSFVSTLDTQTADMAIVAGIIELAHTLGKTVVAEGVETTSQLALLMKRKCDKIQGYLISRPLPAREMESLLQAYLNPVSDQDTAAKGRCLKGLTVDEPPLLANPVADRGID